MQLKRLYDQAEIDAWRKSVADPEADEVPKPTPIAVTVQHATKEWHPSIDVVTQGVAQGWITMTKGKLILHDTSDDGVAQGDITYRVKRGPGHYCCHCFSSLPGDDLGRASREHVAEFHDGVKSPDPQNPSGYERINYYDCVKEEA